MAINAALSQPGAYYRLTVRPPSGCYLMRPKRSKRNEPRAFVDRLLLRGDSMCGFSFQFLKKHPDAVLMISHERGLGVDGQRWEVKRTILVEPDLTLREVKYRPGYTPEQTGGA